VRFRNHLLLLFLLPLFSGCAALATQRLADSLSSAMLNQNDLETVRVGAPAYLLLIDGLIEDSPNDSSLLISGSRLYGAYAGGLVTDPDREKRLSAKAKDYASRAFCRLEAGVCEASRKPYETFVWAVDKVPATHLEALYTYAISWAGWIRARSDDWNALADLSKAEYLLQRVVDIDPGHDRGRAQLYLAVMRTQLPPALGGKPETGRLHFEQAITYSGGRDLMAKVEFARRYYRLVFDQPLHDRLLNEVLSADPEEPGLTLSNTLAQQQAKELLADDYF